jgi:hypothetical protein
MPHDHIAEPDEDEDEDFHDGDDDDEVLLGHASIMVEADGAKIEVSSYDAETCGDLLKLALGAVAKLRRQIQ